MQNSIRKLSTLSTAPSRMNSIRLSSSPVRIHLNIPEEHYALSPPTSSSLISVPTTVILNKNRLTTTTGTSTQIDVQRTARFSSVSSSYAQFLKQRDMDKVKKIVS